MLLLPVLDRRRRWGGCAAVTHRIIFLFLCVLYWRWGLGLLLLKSFELPLCFCFGFCFGELRGTRLFSRVGKGCLLGVGKYFFGWGSWGFFLPDLRILFGIGLRLAARIMVL